MIAVIWLSLRGFGPGLRRIHRAGFLMEDEVVDAVLHEESPILSLVLI